MSGVSIVDGARITLSTLISVLVTEIQPAQVFGLETLLRVADATLLDPGTRPG